MWAALIGPACLRVVDSLMAPYCMVRFSLFFLYFVFCVSVNVKLTVPLLCVYVHSAWKSHPRNDLYCVRWDAKPYTHSLTNYRNSLSYLTVNLL